MNISFGFNGASTSGQVQNDGMFANNLQTAFCYFPAFTFDLQNYQGASGDTWLNWNNSFIRSLDYEVGSVGFALMLHEVLHGLGLKHPHDSGGTGRPTYADLDMPFIDRQWVSVMSYDRFETGGDGAYSGSMPIAPMIMDVIALQYLYGESNAGSGDNAYDLSSLSGMYYNTLWDSSGRDTLDASDLFYGVYVEMGLGDASNGTRTHQVGYITTALDQLSLSIFGFNPSRWTWLWGEYENFIGSSYADIITGNSLDNVLNGGSGNDDLYGGEGNDTFDWDPSMRGGADTFSGGLGDDTYVLDSILDKVIEKGYEGVDTIYVGFNYSIIGTAIENLSAFSDMSVGVRFDGNDWHNRLTGGSKADTLVGWAGNDTIDGGAGVDTAVFSGLRSSYVISEMTSGTWSVSGPDGFDTVQDIEYLQFSDLRVGTAELTDTAPPVASNFSPTDGATGVAAGSNIVVTFNEAIQRGTGAIGLWNATTASYVETYDATSSNRLTITGSTLTIDPIITLEYGTPYYVVFAAGNVKDLAGNNYAGTNTYDFTTARNPDTTPPTASTFSPADGATGVAVTSNIVVTFSEAIQRGTGTIVLRNGAGTAIETYQAATAAQVSISGNQLTLNPSADLAAGVGYRVDFGAGSVKDLAGNNYAGTTTYNFTTVAAADTTAPTVASFSPADGATGVAAASDIILNFSEAIQRGTGNIVLKTAVGTVVETYNAATSGNLSISGNTLTINPSADLAGGAEYRVDFGAGSVKDLAGNNYAGTTTYNFETAVNVVTGTVQADVLIGTSGKDTIAGLAGNDTLEGKAGNDSLDGGPGIDIAVFGNRASPTRTSTGYTVTTASDGTDTLVNVERLKFIDLSVALDLFGNAGTVAKILGAVFGPAAVSNEEYAGIGLYYIDGGMTYESLVQLAFDARLGAGASHTAVVDLLYTNVVGVPPDDGDRAYFVGLLESGAFTVAGLGMMAADIDLNVSNINLVGLAEQGMEYVPYFGG